MADVDRRTVLYRSAAAAAGLAFGPWRASAGGSGGNRPPNIVFMFIDDMGYADPSCFGNPLMQTPNIDRLARQGTRLTNFYVNSPICSPSRVAVTTGQYPARWDIHSYLASRKRNRERGMANWLDPAAPGLAHILRRAGYAAGHFGKWHMGGGRDVGNAPLPQSYGFQESLVSFEGLGDRVLPPGGLSRASEKLGRGEIMHAPRHELSEIYADHAIDFMRRYRDRPFFIRFFPNDVHDPHRPAPGEAEKWKDVTDNPFEQKFFAVLEELDAQIGRMIEEIERLDLTRDTIIILTSDNGPTDWPRYYEEGWEPPGFTGPLFGRKWSLYEGGIRMPFIARWPGTIPSGRACEGTVMAGIDLPPTLCALAGVKVPSRVHFDGEDLSSALLGGCPSRSKPVFWQYGPPHATLKPGKEEYISPSLAVRDGRWKLLVEPGGSGAELYDLQTDIGEARNLVEEENTRASVLWKRLRRWTDDVGLKTANRELRPST